MADSHRTVLPSEPATLAEQRPLGAIWRALSRGELVVHRISSNGPNTLVVFVERSPNEAEANGLSDMSRAILERVLDGTSLKVIAMEADVSLSSASTRFSTAAKSLGLPGRIAALPVVLAELRCADRVNSQATAPAYRLWGEGVRYLVMISPRADVELAWQLPPAEFEACELFLHGLSYRQIAKRRRTSVRTIANQLSAVFRRLGISGRLQLLARVASASLDATTSARWSVGGTHVPNDETRARTRSGRGRGELQVMKSVFSRELLS